MAEQRFKPFSTGSQYADWTGTNCDRCKKAFNWETDSGDYPCEIEYALDMAYVHDGTVSQEIAERMGFLVGGEKHHKYIWKCGEVEWAEWWKANATNTPAP